MKERRMMDRTLMEQMDRAKLAPRRSALDRAASLAFCLPLICQVRLRKGE